MTRTQTPPWERRQEQYQTDTQYVVKLPALKPFVVSDPQTAEEYSKAGARVTARKGWDE